MYGEILAFSVFTAFFAIRYSLLYPFNIEYLFFENSIDFALLKPVQMSRTNFRQKSYFYGIEIDKAKIKIATNGIKADSLEQ